MAPLTHKQTLNGYSRSLLNPEIDNKKTAKIIDEIHTTFQKILGISVGKSKMLHQAAVVTKFGKALGLSYAAECLIDYRRTQQLLKGITSAIAQKQSKNPKETIKVFYAGCGPYAPFLTLVAPMYEPSEVQFTLLDVNTESIEYAKSLVQELGLTAYVDEYIVGDAIIAKIENASEYHILFSETLDSLLIRESYVPILCNLLPQFTKEVILIPENVQLKMKFVCFDKHNFRTEISDQIIFDSRKAVEETEKTGRIPDAFEPFKVPVEKNKNINGIILDTEIIVFDSLRISRSESAISMPFEFRLNAPENVKKIVFEYQLVPEIQLYTSLELN
ncbi:MAG: putative RNA methylase [Crocinitomicaceae bacterium]|jgi:predicted RNA methylase